MSEFKTILTFTLVNEASIARSLLESNDIPVFIKNENTIQTVSFYSNALGGVQLQVPEDLIPEAITVLTDAGYKLNAEAKESKWLQTFDGISSGIPYVKKISPVYRFIILIGTLITLISIIIFGLFGADLNKKITDNEWCVNVVSIAEITAMPIFSSCQYKMKFIGDSTLTIVKDDSADSGKWSLDGNRLSIEGFSRIGMDINGIHLVNQDGDELILKNKQSQILLKKKKL